MAHYLLQLSYSQAAWATMVKRPQNRVEAVRKSVENLGGKITGFWMSFGEHDLVGVLEMPDNVGAAAFAMAIAAGGACHSVKTTPLLTIEEGMRAMKKAGASGYTPVTAKK
ncbi:MAG TPA: GYD domain-containing protein [Bryobacteraceae bacterium]|nr:GYD domain-containing protein [Bryobacteraceae bacterium]